MRTHVHHVQEHVFKTMHSMVDGSVSRSIFRFNQWFDALKGDDIAFRSKAMVEFLRHGGKANYWTMFWQY